MPGSTNGRRKISVFGLGYVGSVTAACLAEAGHEVWGVDVDAGKVAAINAASSPVREPGLNELIAAGRISNRLRATTDPCEALLATDVSIVCVGTPTSSDGHLDLRALETVSRQVGSHIATTSSHHCVVFRSTVLPGTIRGILVPLLTEASGKEAHRDFDVAFNPEFLREGSALLDHRQPPFVIVGAATPRGAEAAESLYDGIEAPRRRTTYEVAEMIKYVCNGFHALKVTFANEVGVLCKRLGIDGHDVMELFTTDARLNLSSAYLRPGSPYGGSCLGKDVRALTHLASELEVPTPVLRAIARSNDLHVQRAIALVLRGTASRVGVLGISFKAETDDLRESPAVALTEALLRAGCQVRIVDPDVDGARLTGTNRAVVERRLPELANLLCTDVDEVIRSSDVVVVCKKKECFTRALEPYLGSRIVIDLVRIPLPTQTRPAGYEGICW